MSEHADEPLDAAREALDALEDMPVAAHVANLGAALDAVVNELDRLSRSVPTVR